jgi:hypothetical protein
MSSEINIQQDGKDEQRRAAPTSPRYAAALVAAMLAASAPMPVLSQGVQLVVVDVHTVAEGYRASKLIGSTVVNDQNEKIGTIEDTGGAEEVAAVQVHRLRLRPSNCRVRLTSDCRRYRRHH